MIGKLYAYFGLIGIASILAWAAVPVVLAVFVRRRSKAFAYWSAYGLALVLALFGLTLAQLADSASTVAWIGAAALPAVFLLGRYRTALAAVAIALPIVAILLAEGNSAMVSAIEADRSPYIDAARARQEEMRQEEWESLKSRAADIRFAEDAPTDHLDLAGVEADDAEAVTDLPPETDTETQPEEQAGPEPSYEYRQRGKKERDPDKKRPREDTAPLTEPAKAAAAGKVLGESDVVWANRLDRANLFAARSVIWIALVFFVADYLLRFNQTLPGLIPLPIAGRVVDSLFPKTRAVHLQTAHVAPVRRYLETAVRKGETFIYFGPSDLWDTPALHRLSAGPVGLGWALRKIAYRPGQPPRSPEFVFESAWFGRYAFVVAREDLSQALAAQLAAFLDRRHRARAAAWQTVSLVWHWPALPETPLLKELVYLCGETNFKLVAVSADAPTGDAADVFDEHLRPDASGAT